MHLFVQDPNSKGSSHVFKKCPDHRNTLYFSLSLASIRGFPIFSRAISKRDIMNVSLSDGKLSCSRIADVVVGDGEEWKKRKKPTGVFVKWSFSKSTDTCGVKRAKRVRRHG